MANVPELIQKGLNTPTPKVADIAKVTAKTLLSLGVTEPAPGAIEKTIHFALSLVPSNRTDESLEEIKAILSVGKEKGLMKQDGTIHMLLRLLVNSGAFILISDAEEKRLCVDVVNKLREWQVRNP